MKGEIDMKKYVKPELCYESFELSEQIAVGCSSELIATYADEMSCTVKNPNGIGDHIIIFSSDTCTAGGEGYCYHTGCEGTTIFTS